MRTLTIPALALALCAAVAGSALADDYDYIRGDDIYQDNYNYGLHYDRLTSLPQLDSNRGGQAEQATPKPRLHQHGAAQAGKAGDRFPNMNAEIKQFRQHSLDGTDSSGSALDGGLDTDINPYSDLDPRSSLHQDIKNLAAPDPR